MKVVLDTNVIVSGMLSPYGPSGEVVRMVASGDIILCYDARIITEYQNVLSRPKFSFDKIHVNYLIDQIEAGGEVVGSKPLAKRLPDPDDEPFLEVAIAGTASYLVTQNLKHYPAKKQGVVQILSPAEFLQECRKKHTS